MSVELPDAPAAVPAKPVEPVAEQPVETAAPVQETAPVAEEVPAAAVSYTHLDVYKRQVQDIVPPQMNIHTVFSPVSFVCIKLSLIHI